ncbi:hypothetical protein BN133_2315 [Cronobacter dublinensis 582]|nr:hypothetical protein BN133_2315 [Cronobacter dublinensis 582]
MADQHTAQRGGATRNAQLTGQDAFGRGAALNAGAHDVPHLREMRFQRFFAVQRQLVFHHQAGERKPGFTAVTLKIRRRFVRVRDRRGGGLRLAEVRFIDDKTAADGVIRLAVDHLVVRERRDTHAVFVQRQVISMEIHALINRERDFMRATGEHQAAVRIDVLNKTRDRVDVDSVRQVAGETHNNGDIGVVAFAGQRQGAVNIHHHFGDLLQQALRDKVIGKLFARFHRPYGMGTGWTNTDFENIKNADHDAFRRINNWEGLPGGGRIS